MKTQVFAGGVLILLACLELFWSTLPAAPPGSLMAAAALIILGALSLWLTRVPASLQSPVKKEAPVIPPPSPRTTSVSPVSSEAEVIGLLSLLQSKGRFIDFLMDDITRYDDKQVGAAARVVHQGCSEVLREYFQVEPVRPDAEGVSVTLEPDYNASQNRLVGKVVGKPPFRGIVLHRGWKTTKVDLPRTTNVGSNVSARQIIAPAEIEVT